MSARKGNPDVTGRSSGKFGGRVGKMMKPPKGQPWVWLTRELLESDAWQSLSINARRFVDFLLLDHMNNAGCENGKLKATYDQLVKFGVTSRRRAAQAISEVEAAGLVDCHRGGMRVATTYTLTFYSLPDGVPPTNRWKAFIARKNQKSGVRRGTRLVSEGEPDSANLVSEGEPDYRVQRGTPSISCRRGATETRRLNGRPAGDTPAEAPPAPTGAADGKLARHKPTYVEIVRPRRRARRGQADRMAH